MHNLAVLYAEGAGGEPDLEQAAELFRQAAEHGVRDSQFNLAILHARGLGVKQDLIEAYKWFSDRRHIRRRGSRQAARHHRRGADRRPTLPRRRPRPLPSSRVPLISEANEVIDAGRRLGRQAGFHRPWR